MAGAEAEATRTRSSADDHATAVEERVGRRLEEAERNATMLRERTTQDVIRSQRAGQEELRAAREEASVTIASARAEADDIRARARALLEDARSEVAVLGRQRDEIAEELSSLSGVIQALAVPAADGPSDDRQGGADTPPDHETQPHREEDHR